MILPSRHGPCLIKETGKRRREVGYERGRVCTGCRSFRERYRFTGKNTRVCRNAGAHDEVVVRWRRRTSRVHGDRNEGETQRTCESRSCSISSVLSSVYTINMSPRNNQLVCLIAFFLRL